MDFAQFKAQLEKSRELEVEVDGARFRLRLASEHAWRVAFEEQRSAEGEVLRTRLTRQVLEAALTGWEGVQARHFSPGSSEEPVAFSAEAKMLLLDERQDIADELMLVVMKRLSERRAEVEAARKNSSRASSGT